MNNSPLIVTGYIIIIKVQIIIGILPFRHCIKAVLKQIYLILNIVVTVRHISRTIQNSTLESHPLLRNQTTNMVDPNYKLILFLQLSKHFHHIKQARSFTYLIARPKCKLIYLINNRHIYFKKHCSKSNYRI